jgi:hypothetical protein
MLEHLPEKFFSEDLIQAHLQSEVGRGELKKGTGEMMKALQRTNPALASSIAAAISTAPSVDKKVGFLDGAFYILSLLDRKFSAENLGKAFNV